MQSLYPPVHHFGKACHLFNADDRNALTPQHFRRAAGGDDVPLEGYELTREVYDAALIRNREKCPHQSSATARTKSAKLIKSFKSTTSAGECE